MTAPGDGHLRDDDQRLCAPIEHPAELIEGHLRYLLWKLAMPRGPDEAEPDPAQLADALVTRLEHAGYPLLDLHEDTVRAYLCSDV